MTIAGGAWLQQVQRGRVLIYDLRVTLGGDKRYFILRVPLTRKAAFLRVIDEDQGYRLEDFGEILYRGWDEPDEELKAELSEKYGLCYS
jgi:hypothetical protein